MKRLYCDRSRVEQYQRCKRSRFWGYEAGDAQLGLSPVRKSIHLVLGGAVHKGLETLLSESQRWLTESLSYPNNTLDGQIELFFTAVTVPTGSSTPPVTAARWIEDVAVVDALSELGKMIEHGVELDILEQVGAQQVAEQAGKQKAGEESDKLSVAAMGLEMGVDTASGSDYTAITEIRFDDVWSQPKILTEADFLPAVAADDPLAGLSPELAAALSADISLDQSDGMDRYLREELAAQVEAMIRAYSRRRLRPLLEQFEVLEVEREGWWKLAQWSQCENCGRNPGYMTEGACLSCVGSGVAALYEPHELFFASRHDGLLLDRQQNSLYLLSYKTTGSWDRRKEMDAHVDQQGLSEAVDVEKRLAEAWGALRNATTVDVSDLVSPRIAEWLAGQLEPPRILGVRYEYLLKGQRRQDKKDQEMPGRYVADTPLIRAYSQAGITADDRRWAWTYDWYELTGKSRRLDYRSWQKQAVWKHMPIAQWIDMLDKGEVQPDSYDENGVELDCLAEQLIPAITVYRSEDDMRDWLEQTEAQEVRVAQDAEEVRRARVEGSEAAERQALNRLFVQTRRACSWPSVCEFKNLCYGSADIRRNPLGSGLYQIRTPNHPIEINAID